MVEMLHLWHTGMCKETYTGIKTNALMLRKFFLFPSLLVYISVYRMGDLLSSLFVLKLCFIHIICVLG